MLKYLTFCILFLISHNASSQGALWLFGYQSWSGPPFGGMKMEFSSGVMALAYEPKDMNFAMTSATITDTMNNILFYTNGVYIANSNGDTMLNGAELSPSYYTTVVGGLGLYIPQAALILPEPNSQNIYYVLHNTIDDSIAYCHKLYYSIIDMTLDNNFGAVISKNNVLINDTLLNGHLTAVKHGNGRDWWIVQHGAKNNKFYFYLLSANGITLSHTQQIGNSMFAAHGQVSFSPDGSIYAMYDPINDLHIFIFDRCTGLFSDHVYIEINDSAGGGGVAFSANGEVLYVSSTNYLYQFDLLNPNIHASKLTVAVWDTFYSPSPPLAATFYLAQLAPDNRIYINSTNAVLTMHYIEYPNNLGSGCNVCQHCITLPAYNGTTMPNHPNYSLSSLANSICDTITSNLPITFGNDQIFIFPNPANDRIYIKLPNTKRDYLIKIFNSIGVDVSNITQVRRENAIVDINMEDFSFGLYFIHVYSNEFRRIERVIKR